MPMRYQFINFKFNESQVQQQLAPMQPVGLFGANGDVNSFQQKLLLVLQPFRLSKWIDEYKELEGQVKGSGDTVVVNSVYYSLANELMWEGYLDFNVNRLPATVDPAMDFVAHAALWISAGRTLVSMPAKDALLENVIEAFDQELIGSASTKEKGIVTERAKDVKKEKDEDVPSTLTLKAFRDEVNTANTLPVNETYEGEGGKLSATRWKSKVEDETSSLGSPVVTFFYAKRTCNEVTWKEFSGKDFDKLPRNYSAYEQALEKLWSRAMTKDTQAARENLLVQWSSLKQTKNESVSGFASRVLDMREERELINMNVSDDEVKAIFRRGLRSPDLALWALDRAALPISKFLSAVISHADEMVRLGVTTSTSKDSQSERKICKFFARTGSCKFGEHCRFKHIITNDDGIKKQTTDESKPSIPQPVPTAPSTNVSPSNSDNKVIQRDKSICYICKRPGHLARNCPNKQQASPLKATEDVTPTDEIVEDDDVIGAISYEEVKPRVWSATKIPITVTCPSSLSKTVSKKALVDTGANKNYLSTDKAALVSNVLGMTTLPLETEHVSKQVDGAPLKAKTQIKLRVSLVDVTFEDPVLSFYVLDKISPEVILGITGLQQLGLKITLQGGITIQQSYVPQFLSTSFITNESEDEVAVVEDTDVTKNGQLFEEATTYCEPHMREGPVPNKDIGYEEALQALMNWQPVRSAPDYSFRVCPIGDKKKDSPNQRYYFEIYIPTKKSHHNCRRKYDYSTNLLSKLPSSDRESYFSEIDQYVSRQWWKPSDSIESSFVNDTNSVSPIIVFPVSQQGRGIRPCADCRETNKCCPIASYRGDSISRIFCKTTTQWRSDYCMACIDAKKAFYRVHLHSPLPVTTNSRTYYTMRMSFGLVRPQYAQIKELTTEIGGQARKWLREWQRGSHSIRGVYDRVFHSRSTSNRYNEIRSFGGPHYSITSDGILTELRYPYGDILAVPYECYLLPTDDINIIESIILFYHERGGHSNSRQTRWKIGRTFRWPHMRRDIERVCRGCTRCQFVAAYRRSRTIRRHLDSSARLPWQVVSVDLLGPLKRDVFNMQYVLVTICHMSRFVVLSALKDASTKSVTNALRDTWCLWGRPITLRADNGPAFRGVFKTEMAKDGVYVSSISRYSPWSNGICERVMATIKSYIKGLNKSDARRWSKFMPVIARRLNTKQLPEGKSPYEILFGRSYPEELESRLTRINSENDDDDNMDEAIENLKKQQQLIISEVLQDRECRDSPQDPRLIIKQPPVGSTVIRVSSPGHQQQDRQVYEVVKILSDGVTVYIRPVNSIVNNDDELDDSDVVREHSSNLKRFWGASCENRNL